MVRLRPLLTALVLTLVATPARAQNITHTMSPGPSNVNTVTFNINAILGTGDDWNASTLDVQTFPGTTIVSPLDNLFGPWTPPFPDTGNTIDTYLRSPSASLALPSLAGTPTYRSDYINASWLDPAGFVSPQQFIAARLGFVVPAGSLPTLSPIGEALASIEMTSVTQQGGGNPATTLFTLYSGVGTAPLINSLSLGDSDESVGTVDLTITGTQAIWDSSSITVTTFNGYELISPVDNSEGPWNPPVSGASLDTYLIDSAGPNDPAEITADSYTPTFSVATWAADVLSPSPVTFHAGRLAFALLPDTELSLTSTVGSVQVATINVTSRASNGANDAVNVFTLYAKSTLGPAPLTHTIALASTTTTGAVDLTISGNEAIWASSTVAITSTAGYSIVSPNDNLRGAWNPPITGDSLDTYVNDWPNHNDLATISNTSYTVNNAFATWAASPASATPVTFRGSRLSLTVPSGRELTLTPGTDTITAATISITSRSANGAADSTNEFTVYSKPADAPDPLVNSVALASTTGTGSVDVSISGTEAIWASSTVSIISTSGYTIVSPNDNSRGAWNPPSSGDTLDTYVNDWPNHNDLATVSATTYTANNAGATWTASPASTAPVSFRGARISFVVPSGRELTLTSGANTITAATITITSRSTNGAPDATNSFTIFSKPLDVDPLTHSIALVAPANGLGAVDLTIVGTEAIWSSSTVSVTSSSGYPIVTPVDNTRGTWTSPALGDTLDTYVNDWQNHNDLPTITGTSYSTNSAGATWTASPLSSSPVTFRGARIALTVPFNRELTLTPGADTVLAATVSITSHPSNGPSDTTDTFMVYAKQLPLGITHELVPGPSAGDTRSFDLNVESTAGDDWNGAMLTIATFRGVTIVSPDDNLLGVWTPPFPDNGNTVDTYLRSPNAALALPQLVLPAYTPTFATTSWIDVPGTVAPAQFLAGRIALAVLPGMQPTFDEIGDPIAEITVSSVSQNGGGTLYTDTFTIYSGTDPAQIIHTLVAGPSEGDTRSFDLNVEATGGDDWNGGLLTISTFRGVTIVSPEDNTFGLWTPPFPDDGTTVDTYLRSPSAPLALPQLILPAYMPTFATTSWIDVPGAVAPAQFLAGRIALAIVPGMLPTFDPIGDPIAQITISSISQFGGGKLYTNSFTVYSGTATSQISQTLGVGPTSGRLKAFDILIGTDTGNHWTRSNLTVTAVSPYVSIVSPEDNATGSWSPPVPDAGTAVDTYLRAPSNAPSFAPAELTAVFTPSSATASWSDAPEGSAPTTFTVARIAFDTPLKPTLSAIGSVIATITIESFSEIGGDEPMLATFNVYDGITNPTATNTLTLGSKAGDDQALNLNIATVSGNPWARSSVTIQTSSLTTIVSPLDNAAGQWAPPSPDTGLEIDTYVRSPSNAPSYAPVGLDATFTSTLATAEWTDAPLGDAPTSFLGARIALHAPGTTPTFSHIGSVIATITVQTFTLIGGNTPTTSVFTIYDGVVPKVTHTLTAGPISGGVFSFNLQMSTSPAYDWNWATLTVTTLGSTRIASPLDNPGGAWTPPYPDDGTLADTYLRAPSNGPRFKPQRLNGTFTDTFLDVRWEDVQTATAPPSFLGGRIALNVPLGIVPTLTPTGEAIAMIHVESSQTGTDTLSSADFTIYDGISGASVNHVLLPGPSAGDSHAFDLYIATGATNDWNLSSVSLETFSGTTIVSPDDNAFGQWVPPFPDDGQAVDTYVRAPSNAPTYFPNLVLPMYLPTMAMVTWFDTAGAAAPQSFQGGRFAFNAPGASPTQDHIGSRLATLDVMSTSSDGGGTVYSDSFELFDGVVPNLQASCTPLENGFRVRVRALNGREGTTVTIALDGEREKVLTFGADGAINTRWNRVHEGTHVVTMTLDSGQVVTVETGCE